METTGQEPKPTTSTSEPDNNNSEKPEIQCSPSNKTPQNTPTKRENSPDDTEMPTKRGRSTLPENSEEDEVTPSPSHGPPLSATVSSDEEQSCSSMSDSQQSSTSENESSSNELEDLIKPMTELSGLSGTEDGRSDPVASFLLGKKYSDEQPNEFDDAL